MKIPIIPEVKSWINLQFLEWIFKKQKEEKKGSRIGKINNLWNTG